jgi:hypothetical protein
VGAERWAVIVQVDAWAARCATCGITGALGRDAVDARSIAMKDGWKAEKKPGEHKSTMTCPECVKTVESGGGQ